MIYNHIYIYLHEKARHVYIRIYDNQPNSKGNSSVPKFTEVTESVFCMWTDAPGTMRWRSSQTLLSPLGESTLMLKHASVRQGCTAGNVMSLFESSRLEQKTGEHWSQHTLWVCNPAQWAVMHYHWPLFLGVTHAEISPFDSVIYPTCQILLKNDQGSKHFLVTWMHAYYFWLIKLAVL